MDRKKIGISNPSFLFTMQEAVTNCRAHPLIMKMKLKWVSNWIGRTHALAKKSRNHTLCGLGLREMYRPNDSAKCKRCASLAEKK